MSSILLTTQEVRELEKLCNDPFMELGMTLRPKHLECFESKIATHSMRVIILFEKHQHAEKWNKMHQAHIRNGGHLVTIAISCLVYMVGGGAARSIGTGSTAAIFKDEVQARIWYPKMFEGWMLTRRFTFRYVQFPTQDFYMAWTDVITDNTGKERERRHHGQSHCKVGGASGLPEKLVRDLMTRFPLQTVKFK